MFEQTNKQKNFQPHNEMKDNEQKHVTFRLNKINTRDNTNLIQ